MEYRNILIKRGLRKNLPTRLPSGMLAFCIDTSELFVGMGDNLPPQNISDATKWLVDRSVEGHERLVSKQNINVSTSKNVRLESQVGEEREIKVEIGKTSKANGRNTFAFFPIIDTFYDEETQLPIAKTQIDLGTDKNPFTNAWVGESFIGSTSSHNTLTNGFIEQWGKVSVLANTSASVTLPVSYSDLSYNISLSIKSDNFAQARFYNVTPNSFDVQVKDYDADIYWRVIGR